jgi:hypothetical protein
LAEPAVAGWGRTVLAPALNARGPVGRESPAAGAADVVAHATEGGDAVVERVAVVGRLRAEGLAVGAVGRREFDLCVDTRVCLFAVADRHAVRRARLGGWDAAK